MCCSCFGCLDFFFFWLDWMIELIVELCGVQELMVLVWDSLCITNLLESKLGPAFLFICVFLHAWHACSTGMPRQHQEIL